MAPKKPIVTDPPEIFIAGIVKVGPMRYSVVTGTVANPIIDTVSQPLEFTAQTLKQCVQRLLDVVP